MKTRNFFIISGLFACILPCSSCRQNTHSPAQVPECAIEVAQRLISDTSTELQELPAKELSYPTIISKGDSVFLKASLDGYYTVSYCTDRIAPEIAYDTFGFDREMPVTLSTEWEYCPYLSENVRSFGFTGEDGLQDTRVSVSVSRHSGSTPTEFRAVPKSGAAFTKHSYAEWHYANGATLDGLLYLADVSGRKDLAEHVEKLCHWTVDNTPLFRSQYESGLIRTQNYRMFRCAMLDDSSGPALPYADLAAHGDRDKDLRAIVDRMADYVMNGQHRLADGTFVRPEPKWTVWCDDMFMGCAFLLRYYDLTGERKYLDEVCRQAVLFHKHLVSPETGLMFHAWNDTIGAHLGAHWGRANGWYLWAVSDLLERLDPDSEAFKEILGIHNNLLQAVCSRQAEDGLWHQVLDHPETYEETSCSCAFTFALARAVRRGWLPESYAENALKGWNGIESRYAGDGVIKGICRSMSVQKDVAGYQARATADNDPRGLGAFFMAAAETGLLKTYLNNYNNAE